MPNDFHFLTPAWFLALLPLAAILWAARHDGAADNAWQRVVDRQLLPFLLMERSGSSRWLPLALVATGWLIAVLALANPTWERRPVPAVRPLDARVVVLDLSQSMDAADLKPSRLARARYKVADILNRSRDGQVGLVAFAGDAFVVAPLSDDADTLLGMLDALTPEVMPVRGSRPDLGLAKAGEVLNQGGAQGGEVILVTDDSGDQRATDAASALAKQGRSVSVIGVGTAEGAPVPGVRDADGHPVMARLDPHELTALAKAGGGTYADLTADDADLDRVLRHQPGRFDPKQQDKTLEADQWEGLGPWISLALLPLAAMGFRRGWLVGALLSLSLAQGALVPTPSQAMGWDDLWQRRDQQAADALAAGDAKRALGLAESADQRGTANFRLGDYPAAADAFAATGTPDGHYNHGNALALGGKLKEAIAAYDAALQDQPGMEDALYNKARVEELLKQQEQQKQKQQQQAGGGEDSKQDQSSEQAKDQQAGQGSKDQPDQPGKENQSGDQKQSGDQDQAGNQSQAGNQDQGEDQTQASGQNQSKDQSKSEQQAEAQAGEQSREAASDQQSSATGQASPDTKDEPETRDAEARKAEADQAAQDYRNAAAKAAQQGEPAKRDEQAPQIPADDDLDPKEREARQAADQWLRRIPDDPSGLLRRKFLYQYRLRNLQSGATTSGNPW